MSAQNGHRFGHNFSLACSAYFKILENTSFLAPSKNTRISYVTTMIGFFEIVETSKSAMALHLSIEIFAKHGLYVWVIVYVKNEKVIA